ncbi:MAG: hypothetical protein OXI33_05675 [Chloroflexota bacterium]|nr:hypothetical protein [Chloroflexota bacterium]
MRGPSRFYSSTASLRHLGTAAVCVLLAATLLACSGGSGDSATDEQITELQAKTSSLEESLEALTAENTELKGEITTLRGHLDDRDARIQELEVIASKMESAFTDKEQWSKDDAKQKSLPEGTVLERTVSLVEASGGEVHYVGHPERGDRTVMVTPLEFVIGETPLIVSLHGFGGDSAYQATYVPLHERVNTDGFALLLPNGALNAEGNRFWNPTDECCDGGKSGGDDVAYLTELVANAREVKDFGPVYFFGYSNGGFMSHHMACKGLPGLRAVASLAGTSYVEDSSCDGAPPVSVLHIHGTADSVILYDGDESEPDAKSNGEAVFYAGAQDIVTRWSRRAGCDWPEDLRPYATLDLDQYVPGSETQAFRLESGCADGITIELWMGEGSSHAPDYGDAFVDALLGWLLSQD